MYLHGELRVVSNRMASRCLLGYGGEVPVCKAGSNLVRYGS